MIDDECPDCGEPGREILYCVNCDTHSIDCECDFYDWWTLFQCYDCGAIWDGH